MTTHGYLKILNWKCGQSFSRWLQRQIHRLRADLTILVCISTAEHNLEKKILKEKKKNVLQDATWRWFQGDNQGWEGPVCQLLVSQDCGEQDSLSRAPNSKVTWTQAITSGQGPGKQNRQIPGS